MEDGRNFDEKPLLVELDGDLYDVAKFARKHPGGEKVLRLAAGEEIGRLMRGERRVLGLRHEHSRAAYRILERYLISSGKGKKNPALLESDLVDLSRPVVSQVGQLGDKYWTWIHQPLERNVRMFQSDYVEMFTRTRWFVIPLIWMPLVLLIGLSGLLDFSARMGLFYGGTIWSILFACGSLAWTLLEYVLHRGVFHWRPDPQSEKQITFHFLLHGLHHKTPMDGDRLVFPPLPAVPIVAFFYILYQTLFPWHIFCAFASGKLFGYICYDMTHYYLHHGSPAVNSNYHYRKVYHHNHHFKDGDTAFGISTNLWDHVFGTVGQGPL